MIRILVFELVLFLVCGFAFWRGGGPERATAGMMLAAAVGTSAVALVESLSFGSVAWGIMLIDSLLLTGLCCIAVLANRFWPLWVAALQVDAIAIHGVRAYDPQIMPLIYAWSAGEIAYPMLVLLAIGTYRHWRRERASGAELGWSSNDHVFPSS